MLRFKSIAVFLLLHLGFSLPVCALKIVKGPYLLNVSPVQITIKWETDSAVDSKLYWKKINTLSWDSVYKNSPSYFHQITLTALSAYTTYEYGVATSDTILSRSKNNYFKTAPAPQTDQKYRFWVTGDCGNNSTNQQLVLNAFMYYATNLPFDGWLLLGDNAYYNGTDFEYNQNFFQFYQNNIMSYLPIWPAPGNHEYANDHTLQSSKDIAYCKIFNTPKNGECGGFPSHAPTYYSFNYDNIHFLSLDSYGLDSGLYRLYDTTGPQVEWIKKDLAQNDKMWTVAYWHHPPHTMGSHNSDLEGELVLLRQNFIQILERNGVDFIFCGHSHLYERSKLLYGFYGAENQYDSTKHALSRSGGQYNGKPQSCAYIKKNNKDVGTIYIVAGSAGSMGGVQPTYPHNAMYYSKYDIGGSLILEIDKNRADLKWIGSDSVIYDSFTVFKNVNFSTKYYTQKNQELTLSASWIGSYQWQNNKSLNTRYLPIKFTKDTTIIITDTLLCLADTFRFIILPEITADINFNPAKNHHTFFKCLYHSSSKQITIELNNELNQRLYFDLFNLTGKKISIQKYFLEHANRKITIDLTPYSIAPGDYIFQIKNDLGAIYTYRILL